MFDGDLGTLRSMKDEAAKEENVEETIER